MSALLQLMTSISHFFRVSFSPRTFQVVENSLYLIPFEREHGIVGKKNVCYLVVAMLESWDFLGYEKVVV